MTDKREYIYVTMSDKFMSGWGQARGKINKLIISCDTTAEARIVTENAEYRSEMIYINMTSKKPYYSPKRYLVSRHGREEDDYSSWFKPGYFKPMTAQ